MCYNPLNRITCQIVENICMAPNIYDMTVFVGDLVSATKPGQFVNLYSKSDALLLPRPLSICGVNHSKKTLRLIYAAVGAGTREFSLLKKGDSIDVLGPFGNGFTMNQEFHKKKILIVGGGVGTPPLLKLTKEIKDAASTVDITVVLGFRDEPYLAEEFKPFSTVYVATDSGKVGFKGNVVQLIQEYCGTDLAFDYLFACGPTPMLRSLQTFALENNLKGEFSLEERMGCGFGGCVGCVVPIKLESDFEYKKVCKDGPIFNLSEVMFE
jgi:dihydroorotate dehydrogenase electron transfer subunit